MEAKSGSEILSSFEYSKKCSVSVKKLVAGIVRDSLTQPRENGECFQDNNVKNQGSCSNANPGDASLNEAKFASKLISYSLSGINLILCELARLVCRARLPGLPTGELSELDAMGRELSEGFAKHATCSLKDGRRPLQGEVVEIDVSDCYFGKISFTSKVLSPLILGPLLFSNREELHKTEIALSQARRQLNEYSREAESFANAIADSGLRFAIGIENNAASLSLAYEPDLVICKLSVSPKID